MRVLIEKSLNKIKSLSVFFNTFTEHILLEAAKGCRKNYWGFIVDRYLALYAFKDNLSEPEKKALHKYETVLGKDFSIDSVEKCDNKASYKYTIHNREELISKGIELDVKKASNQFPIFYDMAEIHFSNTLVMLITKFEEFIAAYFFILYNMFPEKYLNKEKILYSEIQDQGIDEIKRTIVTKVIDETMRDSYVKWFNTMEEHKMNFDSYSDELDALKEIYARRNIIVHNSGIVNDVYLKNVPKTTAKPGEKLDVGSTYIKNAFYVINSIIFKIIIESLRLYKESEQEELCDCIFNLAFDELCEENYKLSSTVFKELINSKHCSNMNKSLSQINYWIAQIELNGLESVQNDLIKYDVSILDKQFVAAKHILLCEYDKATKIIDKLIKTDEMPVEAVKEWPLFKRYRESNQYQDLILQNKELFDNDCYEPQPQSNTEDAVSSSICDDLYNNDYISQEQDDKSYEEQLV